MDLKATSGGAWNAALSNGGSDLIVRAALTFLLPGCLLALAGNGFLLRTTNMEPLYLRAWAATAVTGRESAAISAVTLLLAAPVVLCVLFGVQVGRDVGLAGFGVQLTLLSLLTLVLVPFVLLNYYRRSGRITTTFKWAGLASAVVFLAFQIAQMTTDGLAGPRDGASKFIEISTVFLSWALVPVIAAMYVAVAEEESGQRGEGVGATSTQGKFVRAYFASLIVLVSYAVTVFATSNDGSRLLGLVTAAAAVTLDVLLMCLTVISVDVDRDGRVTTSELRSRLYDPGALSFVCILTRVGLVIGGESYWLLGHSLIYLIFGCALGARIANARFPLKNAKKIQENEAAIRRLLQLHPETMQKLDGPDASHSTALGRQTGG